MADVLATMGMDTREYTRGLRDAERQSERSKDKINRVWGSSDAERKLLNIGKMAAAAFGGAAIVSGATRAVKQYADAYGELTPGIARAREEFDKFSESIGRDLAGAIESIGGGGGLLGMLDSARGSTVNFLADAVNWFGGGLNSEETAADVDEQRRLAEESIKAGQRQRDLREAGLGLDAEQLDAAGDTFGAREAREELRHIQELRKIGQEEDSIKQRALREIEEQRHAARMQAIERERSAEKDQAGERQRAAQEAIAAEVERQTMEEYRLAGMDREIAEAEARARVGKAFDPAIAAAEESGDSWFAEQLRGQRDTAAANAVGQVRRGFDIKDAEEAGAFEERFAMESQRFELDKLRLDGRREEAELLQIELEYQERIAEVMESQAVSADRKREIARALEGQRDELLALTLDKQGDGPIIGGRSLESGLASGSLLAGVLGGGQPGGGANGGGTPAENATVRMAGLTERTVKILERIAVNTEVKEVAVAG